jgi:hypothetical protein
MRIWCTYVRKLMDVYNVPRPDLAERQLRKAEERENLDACFKRAQEIINEKT